MEAALDLAGKAAVNLVAQVIEVDLVDETSHSTVERAPDRSRVVAIRATDDTNAAMFEPADDGFLFDLIARQTVESFEQQHLEPAGENVSKERLSASPARHRRRAADAVIRVDGDDGQVQRFSASPADASLILDRSLALAIG
jgi:hypothetical protein